jgi:drug/metabolite transporter (DMT)-like permease
MTVLLALAAAASWGSSDFVAGVASRRASGLSVVIAAHLTGLIALLVVVPLLAGGTHVGVALGWGAAAGVCGGVGAALLYEGLAVGRMGVVAPITAAGAAALPAIAGVFLGDKLSSIALVGVVLALPAIAFVSVSPPSSTDPQPGRHRLSRHRTGRHRSGPSRLGRHRVAGEPAFARWSAQPGLREALLSGAGFGGFYLCLERAPEVAGMWPLVGARTASVALLVVAALAMGTRPLPTGSALPSSVVVGVLDIAAAGLFLLATRSGSLAVVAVLSSLYPITTVVLARAFTGERCHRMQFVGFAVAATSVGLIAVG